MQVAPPSEAPAEPFYGSTRRPLDSMNSTFMHPKAFVKRVEYGHPQTEEHASHFLGTLGLPHIPVRAGPGYTHAPVVSAPTLTQARKGDFTPTHHQRAADLLFGEWLGNLSDRHGGNYMLHPQHGPLSIDHGASFAPYQTQASTGHGSGMIHRTHDQWSSSPSESALHEHASIPRPGHPHFASTAISPGLVNRSLAARDALAAHVAAGVAHLPEKDRDAAVAAFHLRLDHVVPGMRMADIHDAHDRVLSIARERTKESHD